MSDIKYIDLRIYFTDECGVQLLGAGQLKHSNIVDVAMRLEDAIITSGLSEEDKQNLLNKSLADLAASIRAAATEFIKKSDVAQAIPNRFVEQQNLDKEHVLREVMLKGKCKCPICGASVLAIDGTVSCMGCNTVFGVLQ